MTQPRTLPEHVAIIMDGNGRWAVDQGLERIEGHVEGATAVRNTIETAARIGIKYLTLYAFSVANWARPRIEVEALMGLLVDFAHKEKADLRQNGIRVEVICNLDDMPAETRAAVDDLMQTTAGGERLTVTLALSYGARRDIVSGARELARRVATGELDPASIDEAMLRGSMSARHLPDVDLLVRTSGEARLSDFLLFEAAYAELMFIPEKWPEFTPATLRRVVDAYMDRERRFGLTSAQLDQGVDASAFAGAEGGVGVVAAE